MKIITQSLGPFDVESQVFNKEAQDFLGWSPDSVIQVYDMYEFEQVSERDFQVIKGSLFDSKKVSLIDSLEEVKNDHSFRYRQVTGQYNEHERMLEDMIRHILGFEDARLHHSKLIRIEGVCDEQFEEFKDYAINPVENTLIDFDEPPFVIHESSTEELEELSHFNDMSQEELADFASNFSMDLDDLTLCQNYFKSESRNPNMTELKVIDTYWSDHCRHTTFNTQLDKIEIEAGPYAKLFKTALSDYMDKRKAVNREDKAVSLMDLATIEAKYLREKGILDNVEISAEINACALEIEVDVDGQAEDWILYFKNETHNHPTEIEPFGGASTCVGGGVRDPLSGRSWVYQAMRISGAKNPNQRKEERHPDKLPQRTISRKALEGNSDYGNQIGVTSAYAKEIYHPGYEAKRMELGALISASPRKNVVRMEPTVGDKILYLGGATGRDGLGAAVGSSQIQTESSLENAGAEVQKGAAAIERKITRLFRRQEATRLIKRCNDFGAGGVAVAVGELTEGLCIDLDKVPLKYPGMGGGEIALSESQERMALVIAEDDLEEFLAYAKEEDVDCAVIADVTDDARMTMFWQGKKIIDLSRDFLDTNGAQKHAEANLLQPKKVFVNDAPNSSDWNQEKVEEYMSSLNRASQKSMAEQFDGSIGAASVLFPYGGENRSTPELGLISKLPVAEGKTETTSGMAYGFDPYLSEQSPFHGGYYAVVESISRMVALGFDYKNIRLTFQEFFESLKDDPDRWGKPVLALLGANQAMAGLQIGSIGGKDSMSGSYEDIDVPPTLISFAVANGNLNDHVSRAFKAIGSQVVLLESPIQDDYTLDLDRQAKIFDCIHDLASQQKLLAASTVDFDGLLKAVVEMSYGNDLSVKVENNIIERLSEPMMGSFLLEIDKDEELSSLFQTLDYEVIGHTQEDKLSLAGQDIDIHSLQNRSKEVFASVYDAIELEDKRTSSLASESFDQALAVDHPKALLPVLYGTNGEYDLADALSRAGFEVESLVLADSSHQAFEASIQSFIESLKDVQLLALASGAVFGNEPHEAGRAWELILERQDMSQAIHAHLDEKKLIMGLGASFHALVRSGLIEHGRVTGDSAIRILPNAKGRFISDLLEARVISKHSAFTKDVIDTTYTAPVATSYGRIDLSDAKDKLYQKGQVLSEFTTYFADEHIDALTSPDGLVFGSISNIERVSEDLYQNLKIVQLPAFIQSAFDYCKA